MMRTGRQVVFKLREQEDDSAVTLERLLEQLVICGSANSVADQILALRERAGEFGELVYAGMDWVDPRLAKRSMELMAEKVTPQLDRVTDSRRYPAT